MEVRRSLRMKNPFDYFLNIIFTRKGYVVFNLFLVILAVIDILVIGEVLLGQKPVETSELIIIAVWILIPLHIFIFFNKGIYASRWIMFLVHFGVLASLNTDEVLSVFEAIRMFLVYVLSFVFTVIVMKSYFKIKKIDSDELVKYFDKTVFKKSRMTKEHKLLLKIMIVGAILIRINYVIRTNINEEKNFIFDIIMVLFFVLVIVILFVLAKIQDEKIQKHNLHIKQLIENQEYEEALIYLDENCKKSKFIQINNVYYKSCQIQIYLHQGKNDEVYKLLNEMKWSLYKGYEFMLYYKMLFCLLDNNIEKAHNLYEKLLKTKNIDHIKSMAQKIMNVVKTGKSDDFICRETKFLLVKEVYSKYVKD